MTRGGFRQGAGRKTGSGKFGEPSKPVRLPESLVEPVLRFVEHNGYRLPLYSNKVQAGFPSPADDHIENNLDLNEYLIKHPSSTFVVRASGDSMQGAGIFSGDLLIVDRSLTPQHDHIVIAAVDGQLTVKRLHQKDGECMLLAENKAYPPITLGEGQELQIWGVVIHTIRSL